MNSKELIAKIEKAESRVPYLWMNFQEQGKQKIK